VEEKMKMLLVLVLALAPIAAGQQAANKSQPSKSPVQAAPETPKRTVFNKDFARLLMQAVEAIDNKDGSKDAEHHADDAKAKALAEAEMEMDDTVRENEKKSVIFGLLLVSMMHTTYEISGSESDRRKSEACASAYKDAIRKATVTEQVGNQLTLVLAKDACSAK
jgi:hypothetical protein